MDNINQLIHDLRCCASVNGCDNCGMECKDDCSCSEELDVRAITALEQLQAEISALKEQVRWRDARTEIPTDQEEVLVLTRSKNGVRNIDKGYWSIDRWVHRGRAEVIGWMPLPEPPEEVTK